MSRPAIQVDHLSKRYLLGARKTAHTGARQYDTFREAIVRALKSPFARRSPVADDPGNSREFYALRDVSFSIHQGDVVGVVGRNGAGKSTLLKVLSRIIEPTAGRVALRGRIASLLEVGTGFHPELTGRENIFLNGVILGMTRAEVQRRFDEIVAFAEVEKFLDTPVKHYSSGMYVRLAFAVAAHLDPEILVVDEVLAVGDAEFQRKCLGKMKEVATGGQRTVLFVSHNMSAVSRLCTRGIYLDGGRIAVDGSVEEAIAAYQNSSSQSAVSMRRDATKPHVASVSVDPAAVSQGDLVVHVGFASPRLLSSVSIGLVLYNHNGTPMFGFDTTMDPEYRPRPVQNGTVTLRIPDLPLYSGLYTISIWFGEGRVNLDVAPDAVSFDFISPHTLPGDISTDFVGNLRVVGAYSLSDDSHA